MSAIQRASAEVLDELGSMLAVLRDDAERADRAPAPGLADIGRLVESVGASGLAVELPMAGSTQTTPPALGTAAYRVVQESLTNVLRHSQARRAQVRVAARRAAGALRVEIVDPGPARDRRTPPAPGSGMRGMRERVAATGGQFAAEPTPEGGFVVRAEWGRAPPMIRVLLADDQPLVRAGFRLILDAEDDITVVGEADDGAAALALARQERPDLVLMDIRMPGVDGLEATRRIAADDALAGVKVLILTTFELDEYVFEALRAGASGFLVKHTQPAELIRAVREIAAGEALLSPSVTRRLIAEFAARPQRPALTPPSMQVLTERESEVVALVAQGLTNDEIAAELVLSPATARTHVSRAMLKLGARDRAQLVVFAYQSGLVRPSGVAGSYVAAPTTRACSIRGRLGACHTHHRRAPRSRWPS